MTRIYPMKIHMDMVVYDEIDSKRFRDNSIGLVRGMKTLHEAFGRDADQSIAAIIKHLQGLKVLDGETWHFGSTQDGPCRYCATPCGIRLRARTQRPASMRSPCRPLTT